MRDARKSPALPEVPGTLHHRLPVLVALLLAMLGLASLVGVHAQSAGIGDAARAVVRICGCDSTGCDRGLGSGVAIDPSGVILTANHVTLSNPSNPTSRPLDDFVIEITDNVRDVLQARYRARLAARKEDADLAILQIYLDETTGRPVAAGELALPALPLADVGAVNLGERLHILSYPLAGGAAINYTGSELGGYDEGGAILKAPATLSQGNSGGPALVEQEGGFAVAGVVISRRGDLGEIGRIRVPAGEFSMGNSEAEIDEALALCQQ